MRSLVRLDHSDLRFRKINVIFITIALDMRVKKNNNHSRITNRDGQINISILKRVTRNL